MNSLIFLTRLIPVVKVKQSIYKRKVESKPFEFPVTFMILSCVVLNMAFVTTKFTHESLILWSPVTVAMFRTKLNSMLEKLKSIVKFKIRTFKVKNKQIPLFKQKIIRLALISAMGKLITLPQICFMFDFQVR